MSKPRLKIAVVGLGRRSNAHLPIIPVMADIFDFAAVCDVDAAVAERVGGQYGVPYYSNIHDMLAKVKPDIVDLIVPGDAHHVVMHAVFAQKAHMIVETPLAITLPACDLMIAEAKKAGVKIEVSENVWRFPQQRMHKAILDSGIIGDPVRTYCVNTTGGYHAMNAIRIPALGDATAVTGFTQERPVPLVTDHAGRRITTEHWVKGVFQFDNGVVGIHEGSNTYSSILRRETPHFYRVDGSTGYVVNDDLWLARGSQATHYPLRYVTMQRNGVEVLERIEVETDPPVVWANPYAGRYALPAGHLAVAAALESIYKAVVEDIEPEYGAWAGRIDQEMNMAMAESALLGRSVALPLTAVTSYEERDQQRFKKEHGVAILDVDKLVDHMFPRL